MEHINLDKKRLHLRAQKANQLLLQYRNGNGDVSPGLEAALRIVGPIQRSRRVTLFSLEPPNDAVLLSGAKCSVLFAPGIRLEVLATQARQLGADWAINWDTGVKTIEAPISAPVRESRNRTGNRMV